MGTHEPALSTPHHVRVPGDRETEPYARVPVRTGKGAGHVQFTRGGTRPGGGVGAPDRWPLAPRALSASPGHGTGDGRGLFVRGAQVSTAHVRREGGRIDCVY